jgi:hypothetical protein
MNSVTAKLVELFRLAVSDPKLVDAKTRDGEPVKVIRR